MANSNLTDALQNAAADFIEFYKDHPSYKDAVYKLKQALFEVDLLTMSPGRMEARAASQPNNTGQEPRSDQEPALSPQG